MEDAPRLYNSRLVKTYIEYLGKYYPDVDVGPMLANAEISKQQIEDPDCWFVQDQIDRFHEMLEKNVKDPDISRKVGRYITSAEAIGILRTQVLGFLRTLKIYEIIGKIAQSLTRHITIETRKLGNSKIELLAIPREDVR